MALHGRTLLAVARAGCRRLQDAEEIFQEAALRIWRGTGRLERPERFLPWACAIVGNVAKDRARREKVRAAQPLADHAEATRGPSESRRETILAAVRGLPPPLAEVIELFYFGGLSYREIASAIEMSVPTVNARLTQARTQLRTLLHEEAGDER